MHVIDSHTGGEPTRLTLSGGPDLGSGPLTERARRLAENHETLYQSIVREPRGQTAMVGAMLTPPTDPTCLTGVIYFDAGAVLGMCGHGTIGLVVSLAHLGRVVPGDHKIETPAGVISVRLHDTNTVTVVNVESRQVAKDISLDIPQYGAVTGDVAYGGNWFFIVDPSPIPVEPENIRALTDLGISIRETANKIGVAQEAEIDHVVFQGNPGVPGIHSRNFVLCPDDAYDRSPCGTGSSARLACLAAEGHLGAGEEIIQQSIIGSTYKLSYQPGPNGGVIPSITGQAFVSAEAHLHFDENDPFSGGIAV